MFEKLKIFFYPVLVMFFSLCMSAHVFAGTYSEAIHIADYVKTNEILDEEQQHVLSSLVESLVASETSKADLNIAHAGLEKKIKQDLDRLDVLIINLEKLLEYRYATHLASFNRGTLRKCRGTHEWIEEELKKDEKKLSISKREQSSKDIIKKIERKQLMLTFNSLLPSIPSIWQILLTDLEEAYPYWNAKYIELKNKRKTDDKGFKYETTKLSQDELNFMDIFSNIQVELRRLSPRFTKDY